MRLEGRCLDLDITVVKRFPSNNILNGTHEVQPRIIAPYMVEPHKCVSELSIGKPLATPSPIPELQLGMTLIGISNVPYLPRRVVERAMFRISMVVLDIVILLPRIDELADDFLQELLELAGGAVPGLAEIKAC